MKLHHAETLHREKFADHVLLRYRWEGTPPDPGQFVMARTENSATSLEPFLSRPFFVHDYADGVASLLFEVRGRGTALLANETGMLVSAPLGKGFVLAESGPVALVGGGVWVSPLKLLSKKLGETGIQHDIYLEAPASAPRQYVAWISENYPVATLINTYNTVNAPREIFDRVGDLSRYRALYVSGTSETLSTAKSASEDVVPAQLAVRERMACADGSCHGCAVPVWRGGERTYARACVDGPVFEAGDLAWR